MWALGVVGLIAAVPAVAQAPAANTANAAGWDTLMKLYPPRALAAREQGTVGFIVKLDSKGHPTECQVTKSSGFPRLDQETCDLVTLHAVFKPVAGISGSQVSTHQGAVHWRLPATAAAAAVPAKPVKAADATKKVCRRVAATGSNVRSERVCMTAREWDRSSEEVRRDWDELQGRKGSTNGG
jgi:TonB family protein